ncbi:MAG: hypothetical protein IKT40_14410 [Bacilli bacterium]|nr:hypothetical protein [Bacilli bacterium]
MTTTRKYLKQYDLEIGLEYGIEWGVPNGALRVIEYMEFNQYRVSLETFVDGVAHQFTGTAKEINKWMAQF